MTYVNAYLSNSQLIHYAVTMPSPGSFSRSLSSVISCTIVRQQCKQSLLRTPHLRNISSRSPSIEQQDERSQQPTTITTTTSSILSKSNIETLPSALQKLTMQPRHYAKVHIQNKAYIVTKGDLIHLPVRLTQTKVGDLLNLTTLSSLGSRDFTLRSPIPTKKNSKREFLNPELFKCQATVVEHTKAPMLTTIKKKRRNRHAKAIKSKQPYTVLRITDLEALDGSA